jgi:hypothetical protein
VARQGLGMTVPVKASQRWLVRFFEVLAERRYNTVMKVDLVHCDVSPSHVGSVYWDGTTWRVAVWSGHDCLSELLKTLLHELAHVLHGDVSKRVWDPDVVRQDLARAVPVEDNRQDLPERAAEAWVEAVFPKAWRQFDQALEDYQADLLGVFVEELGCVLLGDRV